MKFISALIFPTSQSELKANIYFVTLVLLVFPFQYVIPTQTEGRLNKTFKTTQQKRTKKTDVALRLICYFRCFQL
jgi:hypothetical protein